MKYHYSNSNDKQKEFIENRIDRDIARLANDVVELIQKTNECWFEDVANREEYRCGECGETAKYRNGKVMQQCRCNLAEDEDPDWVYPEELDMEPEQQEIMQWFILSDGWIADKLEGIGEPVLTWENQKFWGRTCCGQNVVLDPTWWNIYQDALERYADVTTGDVS